MQRFKFALEEVTFLALRCAGCCSRCTTWRWQICWKWHYFSALKRNADIWRTSKPLKFTILALEASTSFKSIKRERQRRPCVGKKWKGKGCWEMERENERWIADPTNQLNLTFDRCLHDNELTHTYSVCMLYWRTRVLHKPLHDYWASLNHTYVSHHHGYNLQ